MVIGSGMVAKRFKRYMQNDNFLIFASGVSNSKSTNAHDYQREYTLLENSIKEDEDKTLVYFSTTSIGDPSVNKSDYVAHKLRIEHFIQEKAKNYIIFRVANLVGKSENPNTVLNFFTHHVKNGVPFHLWVNATRNLIDLDDFYLITDYILSNNVYNNRIINIANPQNYPVRAIIDALELFYKKKANYIEMEKGIDYKSDISDIIPIIEHLKINFDGNYLHQLLQKYY